MGCFHLEDFPKLSIKSQGRSLMQSNTAFWILLCSVSENSHPITYIPKNILTTTWSGMVFSFWPLAKSLQEKFSQANKYKELLDTVR